MKRKVADVTRKYDFDIIQFQATQMAQYLDLLPSSRKSATVLHEIDVNIVRLYREFRIADSSFEKGYRFKDWINMFRYEPFICEKFDKVIACSKQDRDVLIAFNSDIDVFVMPFAVDDSYFDISSDNNIKSEIFFFGSYTHPPNVDGALYFCKEIFPLIKKELPDVKLYIAGGSPPDAIMDLSKDKNITVTGYVQNLNDYLIRATVCVSPIRFGAGQKTKILTALAAGKAVVSTQLGVESIDVVPDRDLIITDTPREFARKTVLLLKDPELRVRLGKNGRKLVQEKYAWRRNISILESMYEELVSQKRKTDIDNPR
jgi:glycosyltransferase involved in cell wall biosynthesis